MRGDFDFRKVRQRGADDTLMCGQHDGQSLRPCLVIAVIVDRDAHGDTGIVDDDVEPAEMLGDFVHDRSDVVTVGDIERPGFGGLTFCRDVAGNGLRRLGADVGDRDLGAFGGEHPRGGAAHAAGGAGDENAQTLDRAAELFEF